MPNAVIQPPPANSFLRYAIWNNKGGVGKTFLSFVLATEYALAHPERSVVVVDICPQANLSEIVLGGNGIGSANLDDLIQKRRTIGGYFDQRIVKPHDTKIGSEGTYHLAAREYNQNLPGNLYLVAGDPSLEVQAQAINQIAAQTLPKESWKNVHSWVLALTEGIATSLGGEVTFFLDCNPSFAAYTELAILAAERLIVPCTADGSSARAVDNLGRLVYGIDLGELYRSVGLQHLAQEYGMRLPTVHLVPLNRSTTYDKKASKAFGAMHLEIQKRFQKLFGIARKHFSNEYEALFLDMPDAHTISVVVSHNGLPVSALRPICYSVHDANPKINKPLLNHCQVAVQSLIARL